MKDIVAHMLGVLDGIVHFVPTAIAYLSEKSSFLTLIGIVVAIWTLREMVKERRESYKPRVVFQNGNFFLQRNSNGTPCFLKQAPDEEKDFYGPPFLLELKNIGLGSAHDISIKWVYDQGKMASRLKEYAGKTQLIRLKDNNHFEFMFNKESQDGYGFFIRSSEEEKVKMAFLSANDSVKVRIPDTLHHYITFVPYLELIAQGKPRRVDIKSDEVGVVFEYYDIGGKKQLQLLKVGIEGFAFAEEDHNKNYGVGTISFSTR
ncbi:MAG: hypothetical protein KAJ90_07015 [Desulfobacterales bacterium]|nr:hypothetical protein [Desulfobacterales bacterium]